MKVKKWQVLKIIAPRRHPSRGWVFATADFDTETDEWWPVKNGLRYCADSVTEWYYGDTIPARSGIDTLLPVTVEEVERQLAVARRELAKLGASGGEDPDAGEIAELNEIVRDLENALEVQREAGNGEAANG